MANVIKVKHKLWKKWNDGLKKEDKYLTEKRRAKSTIYFVKKSANDKFGDRIVLNSITSFSKCPKNEGW